MFFQNNWKDENDNIYLIFTRRDIKDFEHSAFEIESENRSLKYQIELKDGEIANTILRKVTIPNENKKEKN